MIYGSLDQTANREQLNLFHTKPTPWSSQIWPPEGLTSKSSKMWPSMIFPVAPVPSFTQVGFTAQASRKGWAYSLVTQTELVFLMDLQLFLSWPLLTCPLPNSLDSRPTNFSSNLVIGTIPQEHLDAKTEYVSETLVLPNSGLMALGTAIKRSQKMYDKIQSSASNESYVRSEEFVLNSKGFSGTKNEEASVDAIFQVWKPLEAGKSAWPTTVKQ